MVFCVLDAEKTDEKAAVLVELRILEWSGLEGEGVEKGEEGEDSGGAVEGVGVGAALPVVPAGVDEGGAALAPAAE